MKRLSMTTLALALVLALSFAFNGCKKDAPAPGAEKGGDKAASVTGDKAPAAEAVKAPAVAIAKPANVPADVLAYGGIAGFEKLASVVGEVVKAFPGTPNPTAMMYQGMQASLNLKNLDWLDKGKPVYFIAFDERKYAENALALLPLTKVDALIAAMPETKTGDATKGFVYDYLGKKNYLYIVDNYVALTNDAKMYGEAQAFVKKTLLSMSFKQVAEIYVPVKGIMALYGKEIKDSLNMLDGMVNQPDMPLDKNALDSVKKMAGGALDVLGDVEIVKIAMEYSNGTLSLPVSGIVTKGSKAASIMASMASRTTKLYKGLPDDAYITMAFNVDPTLFAAYKDLTLKTYKEMLKLPEADMKKLSDFIDLAYAQSTGDGAFALTAFDGFPVNMLALSGVKDAKKYEKAMIDFWTYFEPKLVALAKEEMGKQGMPPIQGDTLVAVLEAFKPMMEPMGVKLEIVNKDVNGFKVWGASIALDYKNPALAANPEIAMAKMFAGDKLSFLCGGRKDNTFGCVVSPKGDELMKKFADKSLGEGKLSGVSAEAAATFAKSSGFVTMDLAAALKQVSAFPMLAPMKAKIDTLKSAELYVYLKGAGNGFESKLALPIKLFADLASLFGGPQGAAL
jgi:hypothetical protein